MDLNYLLYRHQVSLMRADSSDCMSARHAHRGLARGYAALIEQNQDEHGAGAMLAEAE